MKERLLMRLNESGVILFVLVINEKDLQDKQDTTVLQDCDKVMIIFNFNFTSLHTFSRIIDPPTL
jgi:hypothetical protein